MKNWVIGIGCQRGVTVGQIDSAVLAALGNNRSLAQVRTLASVDIKREEKGLLEFAACNALPLALYSVAQIATIKVPSSRHVQALLGIDGVCEPCAMLASRNGRIVVSKIALDGVTVAIAEDDLSDTTTL
jgi:cobalt-precorrin 5A hydrolase